MPMTEQDIIEHAKRTVMKMRQSGETIEGRMLMYNIANELRSKVPTRISHQAGALEFLIDKGIREGLVARLERPKRVEDIKLTQEDYNELDWDAKAEAAKAGLTPQDPAYHQKFRDAYDRLAEKRLAEKRAKFFPGAAAKAGPEAAGPAAKVKQQQAARLQPPPEPKEPPKPAAPKPTKAELELMHMLTYKDYLAQQLRQAPRHEYESLAATFNAVQQRHLREGKSQRDALIGALAEISPKTVPDSEKERLAKRYIDTLAGKRKQFSQDLSETIKPLMKDYEINKEEIKGMRRQMELSAQVAAFAEIIPRPYAQRFARAWKKSLVAGYSRAEARKIALERTFSSKAGILQRIRDKGIPFNVPDRMKRAFKRKGPK